MQKFLNAFLVLTLFVCLLGTAKPAPATSNTRAANLIGEAERLLSEYKAADTRSAMEKLRAALPLWREERRKDQEAQTLKRIADVYHLLGDFDNALLSYQQSLALARRIDNDEIQVAALNGASSIRILLGQGQRALSDATQALNLSRKTKNSLGEAESLTAIAEVYYWLGDLQRSVDLYQRALPLWKAAGDQRRTAQTYTLLGFSYSDLGETKSAFDSYNLALSLSQTTGDRLGQGVTLTAMGRLYSRLGERQEALNLFDKAMPLLQSIGNPIEEARLLNGVAYTYNDLAEKQLAIAYYEKALALYRTINYKEIKNTLYDLGTVHFSLGEYDKALGYYVEDLSLSTATGDRRSKAYALRGMATIDAVRGQSRQALDHYSRALAFFEAERDLRGQADTLNLIGRIYDAADQPQARQCFEQAAEVARRADYPLAQVGNLFNLAAYDRRHGNLANAMSHTESALALIESLREKVSSPELRASYFSSVREVYQLYINLLMTLHRENPDKGYAARAFETSERARARSLLDTLSAARVGIRKQVDPSLIGRERSLRDELTQKIERKMQTQSESPEAATLAEEIAKLTEEYREISAQVRLSSVQFADNTQPQPLKLEEIQARGLAPDTLLLEFFLGDERSYLWLVSSDSIEAYELPERVKIEDAANQVRSLLTAPAPIDDESFAERQKRLSEIDEQYWKQAAGLSAMLLAPAADRLGQKRLVIVADGALQYIPFNALPAPGSGTPLLVDHEISYDSSASTLVMIRNGKRQHEPSRAVAVFADPVFESDDPRIVQRQTTDANLQAKNGEPGLQRALRDVGISWAGRSIPRLLASRDEAEAVLAATSGAANHAAIGFEADKTSATAAELNDYRIIHFATHGVFDSQHPELSGLLLSRFDSAGRPREGFLRLDDIYNLQLSADLVVLSACNTGLGKDIKGEGLVGLVRGFMYAGTPRVVASLWKVDDDATAELMKDFYRQMLQEGRSPAAALREAQLAMWQKQRWRAPYFWGAFVLQGEYSGTIKVDHPRGRMVWYLVPAVVLMVIAYLAVRRAYSHR